jgi:hypothetical protein
MGRRNCEIAFLFVLIALFQGTALAQTTGTIAGTVTDAVSGAPLTNGPGDALYLAVYDTEGNWVTSITVWDGTYSINQIKPGTYFMTSSGPRGYIDELHSGITCIGRDCRPTNGTPITVTAGSTTIINFALRRAGQIAGTFRTPDGQPWSFAPSISVYNASGSLVSFSSDVSIPPAQPDGSGTYTVDGLATGVYYVLFHEWRGYLGEVYGGLRCTPVGFDPVKPPCAVTFGTPVNVTAGATTTGIDFMLDPGGRITGVVRGDGGELLPALVRVLTAGGEITSGRTGTDGRYTISGLPAGGYRVRAEVDFSAPDALATYVPEWSDGLCVGCAGTPASIAITEGVTTTVDFSLARGGTISGSAPCCAAISAYDSEGRFVKSARFTTVGSSPGQIRAYAIAGLPAGTFYLRQTDPPSFGGTSPTRPQSGELGDFLYGGVPCITEDCDVRRGTPVVVRNGETTAGIDFPARTLAAFAGVIPSGAGLSPVTVDVYDARGVRIVGRLRTLTLAFGAQPVWGIVGVPEGVYYARLVAVGSPGRGPIRLYGGPVCSDCPVTSGTPIYARAGTNTVVNFSDATGRAVRGHVRDSTDALSTVTVEILTRAGSVVGFDVTDSTGLFIIPGLAPGTYYARTKNERGYVDEVYDNVSCALCDITRGTPVVVSADADTVGVDFSLVRGVRVSGTVTGAGLSLQSAGVSVFDAGGSVVGRGSSSTFGQYAITVPAGTTFGRTEPVAGYRQELYRELPCANGTCSPTTGTPIIASGASVTGIDFTLASCGTMTIAPVRLTAAAVGSTYRQVLTVSGGASPMQFSVIAGNLPAALTLDATTGVLAGTPSTAGHYDFTLAASDGAGCVATRVYALEVPACPFVLERSSIAIPSGGANSTLGITGACGTTTAVSNDPWIRVLSSSSTAFQIGIDPNGSSSPRTGTVTVGPRVLTVLQAGTVSAVPFGVFETPADGAAVTGSVAVTGWTLDDVGVVGLTIVRDPVAGESGGLVPIGQATFVEGARPDVEAAFPAIAQNRRAGWGYLLLTNMLPNGGNGTFRLHAYAVDAEQNLTLIGTKTINAVNATATLPFGAIDTPTQGGSASGTFYVNFGWALTPQPQMIPTNGSTIQVFIDGAPMGPLSLYNQFRSDVSTLFPGLKNSSGPVGYRIFDTTRLEDGIHTIAWSVTDDGGRAQGIGSRYFFVNNSAWTAATAAQGSTEDPAASRRAGRTPGVDTDRHTRGLEDLPLSRDVILLWRDDVWVPLAPADRTIAIRELDRVELNLAADVSEPCAPTFAGYLVANGRMRELPAGASIDPAGRFYWQPGAGFLGTYQLLFVRTACDGSRRVVPVNVDIR